MKGGELMAAWIARVKGLSFELKVIGSAPTEEDIILILTNGLPLMYTSFVIALDATLATDVTLVNVISWLANKEGWQETYQTEEDSVHDPGLSSLAAVVKVCHRHSDITCFECGEKGHYRSECLDLKMVKKGKQDTAAMADGGEELFVFWLEVFYFCILIQVFCSRRTVGILQAWLKFIQSFKFIYYRSLGWVKFNILATITAAPAINVAITM
jgi:hypothetical protein